MIEAYGLKTHIWNNNLRSVGLLLFFPILLMLLAYGVVLLFTGYTSDGDVQSALLDANRTIPVIAPWAIGGAAGWFAVAFLGHQKMIDMATKARSVTQAEEPRAYNMLENLSISRGQTMPRLKIIETPAMNAYASGIRDKNYTVTLTRGLMNNLDDAELRAVIAHELSHIRHKDVRVLIIAVIFVGIFSFFGEIVVRGALRTNYSRSVRHHRRSGGGNSGALIFFAIAIIAVSYFLAMLVRFSLSRKREYMADAGAVELTKDPDAMIRALQKISGKADLGGVPAEVMEMAIENPATGFAGMFATHPPIEKRIDALVKFAGGRPDSKSNMPQNRYRSQDREGDTTRPSPIGRRGPWTRPR